MRNTGQFSEPYTDVLGEEWVARTVQLRSDGHSVTPLATLVHCRDDPRAAPTPTPLSDKRVTPSRAVLYLHGFTDYFFQTHHALMWQDAGFTFYALDLRDYGRSIQESRDPNWVLDLQTYDEEINAALGFIRARHDEVVIAGHSMGGLIASLYADRHPGKVSGVVLNSPWLDLNEPWVVRHVLAPLVRVFGPFIPRVPISSLGPAYGRSLHSSLGGEWDYDLRWKPFEGFGVRAGWLSAILTGHRQVKAGLNIAAPVLLSTSGARGDNNHPTAEELATTDVVLSPPQMWRLARNLGRDVTVVRISGGLHDLSLSAPDVRNRFADQLRSWLNAHFPSGESR